MGLAASQAKLLSITTRLSDNELRSQSITAAKLALSNQTSAASKKYINALNSTELLYGTYDMNGNKTSVALTGNALSEYAPLKNQYALINSAGQVLVSETEANYYNKSENLYDFLKFNGIKKIETGETRSVTNPDYEQAYADWMQEYKDWEASEPNKNNDKYWKLTPETDNELYNLFKDASATCFSNAMGGSTGCYAHVLAHMLELDPSYGTYPKNYTTSTGKAFQISSLEIAGSAIHSAGKTDDMVPVSEAIQNGYRGTTVMAAEHADDATTIDSTEGQKLLSNYTFNENGEKVLKTLSQKCKDLFYAIKNYSSLGLNYNTDMKPALQSFQEDMSIAFMIKTFLTDVYEADYNDWLSQEPDDLETPPTLEVPIYEYSDEDKAQWYTNLWYRMNGNSEEKNGTQTTDTTNTTGYWNEMIHNENSTTSQRWAVLEDGLMNSSKWLQNALTQGTVTLEQVQFTGDGTESNTGLENVTWTSIIYTSAQDISEKADETAIAKAEAEYQQAQNDIEAKDKQFDNMLKLLDTEHEALQTEYDSVQQVINKNIQRTLKIYSA